MAQDRQDGVQAPLWNDDEFRSKVSQLAADRGKTVAEILRSAGLSASYLSKPAGRFGRSVEAIMGIAAALNVSVIELVGVLNYHDGAPSDENLARLVLVAEVATYLHVALGARRQMPVGVPTQELVAEILRFLDARIP